MTPVDITVVEDAPEAARIVAERLVEQAHAGGHVVLTGGSTPRLAYELAADLEPDWSRVEVWWETSAARRPRDQRSNYRLTERALLDKLDRQPLETHRMRGELGPDAWRGRV